MALEFTVDHDHTAITDEGEEQLIGDIYFTVQTRPGDFRVRNNGGATPRTINLPRRTAYLGVDGHLYKDSSSGEPFRLVGNDPAFNLEHITYRVDFNLTTLIGEVVPVRSCYFPAPSTDTTVYLTRVMTDPEQTVMEVRSKAYAEDIIDSTPFGRGLIQAEDATDLVTLMGVEVVENKGDPGGYAPLDDEGNVPPGHMPPLAVSDYLGGIDDEVGMLALDGQKGDWITRTDLGTNWQVIGDDPSDTDSWLELSYPAAPVSSVAGKTGVVTLVTTDLAGVTASAAEVNVLDGATVSTAELNILDGVTASTAELNHVDGVTSGIQTQLDGKANTSHTHTESDITGLTADLAAKVDKSTLTTKGDLYAATGSAAVTRVGVGSDGQALVADSTQTAGVRWGTQSGAGTGDASTNTATSVDSEIVLFSGTAGKTLKRASTTGLLKGTSGVLSAATAGTDYAVPNLSGAFASLPAAATAGRYYICTDIDLILRDNGTSWDRVRLGSDGPAPTAPPSAGWSNVNIGSASFAASLDGRLFTAPSNGSANSVRAEVRTLSPSSNYTATAYVEIHALSANSWGPIGPLLRNSSSGSLISFGLEFSSGQSHLRVAKYTNSTTYSADYFTAINTYILLPGMINWFRIVDNGTNRLFQYSYNGVDWNTVHSVGRTDFITPDQIGWGGDPHSTAVAARLRSFSVV